MIKKSLLLFSIVAIFTACKKEEKDIQPNHSGNGGGGNNNPTASYFSFDISGDQFIDGSILVEEENPDGWITQFNAFVDEDGSDTEYLAIGGGGFANNTYFLQLTYSVVGDDPIGTYNSNPDTVDDIPFFLTLQDYGTPDQPAGGNVLAVYEPLDMTFTISQHELVGPIYGEASCTFSGTMVNAMDNSTVTISNGVFEVVL